MAVMTLFTFFFNVNKFEIFLDEFKTAFGTRGVHTTLFHEYIFHIFHLFTFLSILINVRSYTKQNTHYIPKHHILQQYRLTA